MIPRQEARVIVAGLVNNLLRGAHRAYLADDAFPASVAAIVIIGQILLAEARGEPLSDSKLARLLEVPRTTLHPRLAGLMSAKLITRESDGWRVNGEHFASPKGEHALREACQMIIEAADSLRKLDSFS